jgi:quercetin dioxygenase-like cupin family protein
MAWLAGKFCSIGLLEECGMNTVRSSIWFCAFVILMVGTSSTGRAQDEPSVVPLASSQFKAVPNTPACLTGAVQHGDPAKGAAVLLAKLTVGCIIPWHWHTQNENLIIVSGEGRIEMKGGTPRSLVTGDYFFMPAGHQHQFTCVTACTFFNVIDRAFDIHYVDPDGKEITLEEALKLVPKR